MINSDLIRKDNPISRKLFGNYHCFKLGCEIYLLNLPENAEMVSEGVHSSFCERIFYIEVEREGQCFSFVVNVNFKLNSAYILETKEPEVSVSDFLKI